jgi:hypothetical protein
VTRIEWPWQWPWNLNIHEVNKDPTSYIKAMHAQIVWGPYASKEIDIPTLDNHVT